MFDIITTAENELRNASDIPSGTHIKTGDIRRVSAKLFSRIKDKTPDYILMLCGELLERRNWPMGVIAYDFAYRLRDKYDASWFPVFESWLEKYVRGWGDCDDFCTHAFGELIRQNTVFSDRVIEWTSRGEFWMRRASAVVLIPSIHKDKYRETKPLRISDILMGDSHDLVRKGYGWMLKTLSLKEPDLVFDYLRCHKTEMPGVAFRYAMEKMDADKKRALLTK